MGFLDENGLAHFWEKVKSYADARTDGVTSEELSAALLEKQDRLTPDDSIILDKAKISVALPTAAVTKAEYNALNEEEKNADVLYVVDEPPIVPVPLSIQEYDTADGWHVRKWSAGYVEEVLIRDFSVPFGEVIGGGFRVGYTFQNVPFPVQLTSKYGEYQTDLTESEHFGTIFIMNGPSRSDISARHSIMTLYSGGYPPNQYRLSLTVTGRWK